MNYEHFKGIMPYGDKILGKPNTVQVTIKMDAETHHYIKYLATITDESVAFVYNDVMSKYVNEIKSSQQKE